MTIYVDDFRVPARAGRLHARWSHLTAGPDDDLAELHAFAARIGLRREWFQDKPWPRAHYDVTDSKRRQAIAAGAVPVTCREAGEQRISALQAARRRAESGITAPARGGGMIGRVYLERGQPVTVLARWAARPAHGPGAPWLIWCRPPRPAPRNVLIERADGRRVVRPFRGLRTARQELPG